MMTSAAAIRLPVPRLSPGLLAVVLLAHAGVLLAMVTVRQLVEPVAAPRALSVSLIEMPEEARKPEPRPQPPKPVFKPQPKPQVLAVAQPKIVPAEQEPMKESPQPVAQPTPPAAVADAALSVPPPPVIQPRFDANYLDNPRPAYPLISKRMGEQGTVQLRVYVNADGDVAKLELKRSSGHARLDQSAMSTVQNWRFVPARQGNQATAAWVVVPINFTLGS